MTGRCVQIRSYAYKTVLNTERPSVSIIAQFLDRSPMLLQDFAISRLYCATRVGCTGSGFASGLKKTRSVFALRVLFASVHPASFPPQGTNSQAAVAPSKRSNFPSLRRNGIVSPLLAKHHVPTPAASHRPAPNIVRPSVRSHAVSLRPPTIQRALT